MEYVNVCRRAIRWLTNMLPESNPTVEALEAARVLVAYGQSPPGPPVSYWEYLQVDALLRLQKPKTACPDEKSFIVLHQIAELIFALVIHELQQITDVDDADLRHWKLHLGRVINYFSLLIDHLAATRQGVAREEFRLFRKSLFPASAFQSFQYRKIEILSADLYDLVHRDARLSLSRDSPLEALLDHLYWRRVSSSSGEEQPEALREFEKHYLGDIVELAAQYRRRSLALRFRRMQAEYRTDPGLINLLRKYDRLANLMWPEAHLQLALSFLMEGNVGLASTGGADWAVYLKAKQHHIRYFPDLIHQSV
jgi:tryptophan 2,3-dioxygenase